jgi:5-methylcytosine-specific restriction enzyme A
LKTKWDLFSADLIQTVENFYREDSAAITALEQSFPPEVTFMKFVNGSRNSGRDIESSWKSIDFQWITPVEEIESNSEWKSVEILLETSASFLFDVLSSALRTDNAEEEGKIEGFTIESKCGRYSRSATNRKACLKHFGYVCAACGFEPAEAYGPDGIGVIHVHHLTPLSKMTKAGPVSPIEDLVPLCANCHNFAHRKSPPYTPEEIRENLKK